MALSQHKLNQGDSDHSQLHCLRLALFAQSRDKGNAFHCTAIVNLESFLLCLPVNYSNSRSLLNQPSHPEFLSQRLLSMSQYNPTPTLQNPLPSYQASSYPPSCPCHPDSFAQPHQSPRVDYTHSYHSMSVYHSA